MQPVANTDHAVDAQRFWQSMQIWPHAYERWTARNWVFLVVVPYAFVLAYAVIFTAVERRSPPALGIGYLLTLGLSLLVSGFLFEIWERAFRDAIGGLYARNSVVDTPVSAYLDFSREVSA